MEVGTNVEVEDPSTGLRQRVCRAYFTYVAQSIQGAKQPLPPVYPSTPIELKEFLLASERRRGRLTRKASYSMEIAKQFVYTYKGRTEYSECNE